MIYVYPQKEQKEEKGKDTYKEIILQAILITNRYCNMIQAIEYLNDNPELYSIAYKALELFEKRKRKIKQ